MTITASTSAQVVLGSMERVEEYGSILTSLKANGGNVQGEMVDRVLGGGMSICLYLSPALWSLLLLREARKRGGRSIQTMK